MSSAPGPDQAASGKASPDVLTRWGARTLRRFTAVDLAYGGAVIGLVALVLWSGHAAARHLSPSGAQSVSRLLDDLELPTLLPNAVLVRDDGASTKLWDASPAPRILVSFYAPWCAPCQEELPTLVRATADKQGR